MARVLFLVLTSILSVSKYSARAEQLLCLSSAADVEALIQNAWTAFKTNYEKSYSGADEELRRKQIFSDSLKTIEGHNRLYESGQSSYRMGINEFSDMELSEVVSMMGFIGSNMNSTDEGDSFSTLPNDAVPSSKDWRKYGYVTHVKKQGQCGSCWAFSATGSLEGQTKRKTGRLVSLSEQNLVDCAGHGHGCNGSSVQNAFEYIKNNGISAESCYPYKAKSMKCRHTASCRAATVRGYRYLQRGSELALTRGIAVIGPISVAINLRRSLTHYKSGIYSDPSCSSKDLNHAVLAVGYGVDNGQTYYLVKNSWGARWGENGYIRIARNKNNMCGIASDALYPIV